MPYAVIKVTDKIVRNPKFPYRKEIVSQQEIVEILEDPNEAFKKATDISISHCGNVPPYVQRIYGLSVDCNNKEEDNDKETNEENEKIIFPHKDFDLENIFKTLTENNEEYNNSPVIVKKFIKENFVLSMKWAWDKYSNSVPTASKSFNYTDIQYMNKVTVLFNLAQNVYTAELSVGCDDWFNIMPREGE